MDARTALLLATVAFLTVYVVGVGGTTATAIRVREAWRRRKPADPSVVPAGDVEVLLSAPALPRAVRVLRITGWVAFLPALGLAVFADPGYPWVLPVAVILMVALNAFYVTAMQNTGEQLILTADGFRLGPRGHQRSVRWIHVTELTGARVGAFSGMKMSEAGEWQDPKLKPNVILYRLNRALVDTRRTFIQRVIGFTYYDGVIRNAFGIPTDQLLQAMPVSHRRALDAEAPPLGRSRTGQKSHDSAAGEAAPKGAAGDAQNEERGGAAGRGTGN